MLTKLLERVTRRQEQKKLTAVKDIRQAIILSVGAERGETTDLNDEHFAELFEQSGLTTADLAATETVYLKRIEWAALAADVAKKTTAAEVAEKEWKLFDQREAIRRREALKKLESMESAFRAAMTQAKAAQDAHGNLIAGADVTPEERDLSAESATLGDRERNLRGKLSPRLHGATPGFFQPSLGDNPGALAAQTRAALGDEKATLTAERRAELQNRLHLSEQAIATHEKELAAIEQRRGEINTRLRQLSAAKLRPEAFRIVKAKPDRDAARKARARELGYQPEPLGAR